MITLKEILKEKDIRHSVFAKEIGATSQQVWNWFDRGDIPKGFILPISKFLNMKIEKVLEIKASNKESK